MSFPSLTIGNLTIALPIIQGGMGIGISLSGLASAVAAVGGVGVISAAGVGRDEPDYCTNFVEANSRALKKQIQKARELTKGILGVNVMVALSNFAEVVKTSVKEKIDIIFSGAGLPLDLPKYIQDLEDKIAPKLVPIVSSARAAAIICKKWASRYDRLPDALVVEGPMAGGHLGFKPEEIHDENFRLERLIPEVVEAVRPFEQASGKSIPVIAAGGIYTGADIRKFLDLGAKGVQLGTRFVATHECDAAIEFKQAYVKARKEDIEIVKSPVGMPGRAIHNVFLDRVDKGEKKPAACPYHCLRSCNQKASAYCISVALGNAKRGQTDNGLIFCGANAWRVKEIVSVQELVHELSDEYERSAPGADAAPKA
ncbi:MAG: NAD(P)H-dependent flavin oxidoreductase [Desulfovibrionaceae bacterium]